MKTLFDEGIVTKSLFFYPHFQKVYQYLNVFKDLDLNVILHNTKFEILFDSNTKMQQRGD